MVKFAYASAVTACLLVSSAWATVVTPSSPDGWAPANVRIDAKVAITSTYQPPGEQGSLQFTTNTVTNGQDKTDYVKYYGVVAERTLGNITNLEYDIYRASSSTTG